MTSAARAILRLNVSVPQNNKKMCLLIFMLIIAADPEFGFCSKLKDKKGKTKRKVQLKCKVDDPNARVKWFKNGKEVSPSDPRLASFCI